MSDHDHDPSPSTTRSPSLSPPTKSISRSNSLSIDASLSQISLSSERGTRSRTLTPTRNGHLSPRMPEYHQELQDEGGEEEDEYGYGDIGYSIQPSSPAMSHGRSLTPSRMVSPASNPVASGSRSGSPRVESRPGSPSPMSRSRFPASGPSSPRLCTSGSGSPQLHASELSSPRGSSTPSAPHFRMAQRSSPTPSSSPPLPRFVPFKPPSQPHSHPGNREPLDLDTDGENADPSAPFESIPLSLTPPPPSTSVPLPSSPRMTTNKRSSFGGFGMTMDGERFAVPASPKTKGRGSMNGGGDVNGGGPINGGGDDHKRSSLIPPPDSSESVQSVTDQNGGSTTPPRRHAPPAHPHPFPLPSSPSTTLHKHPSSGPSTTHHPPSTHNHNPTSSSNQNQNPNQNHGLGKGGPSTLEFISQTRPSHLPPKPPSEDQIHLNQWSQIMAQSRASELDRQRTDTLRRAEKDRTMGLMTAKWERVLNDPDFSALKVRSDPGLRKMWFDGIPPGLRGRAWGLVVGNPLAMSRDAYKTYSTRAQKALQTNRFPKDILDQMEIDMDETLPSLRMFVKGSPMRADLREVVCAWVVWRSDEGFGYAPYITHLTSMLLLTSPPPQTFHILINLLSRPFLRAFYTQTQDEIEAYYRVFENLQADLFPKIYANCKNLGLRVPEGWFRSLLVEWVPFEACCRLWDQIMIDGDGYIFRSALAIVAFLEPRLHYPDKDEIASVLEGRNRATLAITERERERAKLKGEVVNEMLDGKLSVFGLNEGALFEFLEGDGWRESRFERLVTREMPD